MKLNRLDLLKIRSKRAWKLIYTTVNTCKNASFDVGCSSYPRFSEVLLKSYTRSSSRLFCRRNDVDAKSVKSYRKITHCFFDLDGTIVDSEATYHRMLRLICKKYGAKYGRKLEEELQGATDTEICSKLAERLKLPISSRELKTKANILSKRYLPLSPLKKGASKLLYHLYEQKIPMALVTNATMEHIRLHEKVRPKLFALFHHKVCSNDPEVNRPKPFPDSYLLAAKRFPDNPKPENCLAFEDSLVGLKAAVNAKMQVVLTPNNNMAGESTESATIVLKSLLEFQPEAFGLPPYDKFIS